MNQDKKIILLKMKDVINKPIEWLWTDWLPIGKLTLLAGPAGVGKTTLLLDIIARFSNGSPLPFENGKSQKFGVIIYSNEDSVVDTINPRLTACNANESNICYINGTTTKEKKNYFFDPTKDFKLIEECLINDSNIRIIVIDPIVSVISGDMHKSNEVRKSLGILVEIAQKYNCAIIGITHFSKNNLQTSPVDKVIGSQAFTALARMVWIVVENNGKKILVKAKSNISTLRGAYLYEIENVRIKDDIETTRVKWIDFFDSDYHELMKNSEYYDNTNNNDSNISHTKNLILNYLIKDDITESKKLENYIVNMNNISQSTYRRAIKSLKSENRIETFKEKNWFWRLIITE